MSQVEAESLFASMFHRWSTGDISNFERDYSEEVLAFFDDDLLGLEDLKQRVLFFYKNFEILDCKILDLIYDSDQMAVRLFVRLKKREDQEIVEDTFNWFYEIKERQVVKYWAITNFDFGFNRPKKL